MCDQSLPQLAVAPLPAGTLAGQLVRHGGRAALINDGQIPDEELNIALAVDLRPWGTDYGCFRVVANGPELVVNIKESLLFAEGSPDTTIIMDIVPRDVEFINNTFFSAWTDGQEDIRRRTLSVDPASRFQFLSEDEFRPWSYRLVVAAPSNAQVELLVQVLPLPLAVVKSSPWSDSPYLGGIIVSRSRGHWFPQLSPACSHVGPAPYLVDRRSPANSAANILPSSQSYRDLVVTLLSTAVCPAGVPLPDITADSLSTRKEPLLGSFTRGVEMVVSPGTSVKRGVEMVVSPGTGVKRPRLDGPSGMPPPAPPPPSAVAGPSGMPPPTSLPSQTSPAGKYYPCFPGVPNVSLFSCVCLEHPVVYHYSTHLFATGHLSRQVFSHRCAAMSRADVASNDVGFFRARKETTFPKTFCPEKS
jgi:hypothetical protein